MSCGEAPFEPSKMAPRDDIGTERKTMPIAIIGMSCRFPGDATSPERLWDLCAGARDGWSTIPKSRFNLEAFYDSERGKTGTTLVTGGYFLQEEISLFDPSFFHFSYELARIMDPQIRFLLESVFECSENAGIPIEKLAGSDTSVYIGSFSQDYYDAHHRDLDTLPTAVMAGNGNAMKSNRISHFFDLRGASMTIDTGCSASMVALHLACQSIRNGESRMAVAGGSNIMLNPDPFITLGGLGVLGADGRCYAWDNRADGYGRGEGISTILLKPLEAALADGDHIHAVIRETALNQDGKTNTITTPSEDAQYQLIRDCYQRAGLEPSETGYVEAHMTGTPIGDPIEANAISRALSACRKAGEPPLIVGSVKTNIGHQENGSGVAGIIKTVMALQKRKIPPNVNLKTPNKRIDMDALGVRVPLTLEDWPAGKRLRASINSYGYGGTNAHAILDAASEHVGPQELSMRSGQDPRLFILSSKNPKVTKKMADNLNNYLISKQQKGDPADLDDLSFTLSERRSVFPWRTSISALGTESLIKALDDPTKISIANARNLPKIGFVFTGQGAQWYAMARELIKGPYLIFQESLSQATLIFKEYGATWSLLDELTRDEASSRVGDPEFSQPICVALQICLVDLLVSWGVKPNAVVSHSSGEIAAAYAAGVLNFEEALGIAYFRGVLTQKYQKTSVVQGGMLAVGLGYEEVRPYLNGYDKRITVACINSPASVTLSGDLDLINQLGEKISQDGAFARKLKVKSAYHSAHMLPMADEYLSNLQKILSQKRKLNQVLYASPVTGDLIQPGETISPQHWVNNLLQPVRFSEAIEKLCQSIPSKESSKPRSNVDILLEVGPHSALAGPIRQILTQPAFKDFGIQYASCLLRGENAIQTLQAAVGMIWSLGGDVLLSKVNSPVIGVTRPRVIGDLPSYPWDHTASYWKESPLNLSLRQRKSPRHDLLGSLAPATTMAAPAWRSFIRLGYLPWLGDHKVQSDVVFPGAGGISMAIEAMHQLTSNSSQTILGFSLRNIQITNALVVPNTVDGVEVSLSLHKCNDQSLEPGWYEFALRSLADTGETWTEHSSGLISAKCDDHRKLWPETQSSACGLVDMNPFKIEQQYQRTIDPKELFSGMQKSGVYHGHTFQNLLSVYSKDHGSLVKFQVADIKAIQTYLLHPTTLDSVFQGAFAAMPEGAFRDTLVVPRAVKEIFVHNTISNTPRDIFSSVVAVDRLNRSGFHSSITVASGEADSTVLEVRGLFCQAVAGKASVQSPLQLPKMLFKTDWFPDMTLMAAQAIEEPLKLAPVAREAAMYKKLIRASWHLIHDALSQIDENERPGMEWHHQKYLDWMKNVDRMGMDGMLAKGSASWIKANKGMKQLLYDEVAFESVNGRMLCRIGQNITNILRKYITPLELMMEENLLYTYYEDAMRVKRSASQVKRLVQQCAIKHPRANVLEIGGGTGGTSASVLEGLTENASEGKFRFASYTFTDISPGFFEKTAQKLAIWQDMMIFKKLDIETDPVEQGFVAGAYDIIFAFQVLHATKNMIRTMTNVRKLLKPGGKLVLIETTNSCLDVRVAFGTLPGWWLSEEEDRQFTPTMSIDSWSQTLKKSGFSGIDLEVHDWDRDEDYEQSVIMSTAVTKPQYPSKICIVGPPKNVSQSWVQGLKRSLERATGASVALTDMHEAIAEDQVCIFLWEIEDPVLAHLNSEEFQKLQQALTTAKGVLWITRGSLVKNDNPEMALIHGLLRTARSEDISRRYISLDLDADLPPWHEENQRWTIDIFKASFDFNIPSHEIDVEYAIGGSVPHIQRVQADINNSMAIAPPGTYLPPQSQPFMKDGRELQLMVQTPGFLDTLAFEQKPASVGDLPENLIEIEPKAFGVNFRDILIALGQLEETEMAFEECSGIVTAIGSVAASKSGLQVGDRVCTVMHGEYATRVRVEWFVATRIPDHMSFEEAASIPVVWMTAYFCLCNAASLSEGETILIHAGSGAVGQAAIMLAQHLGAIVYTTVSTPEKRNFLVKKYGIPLDHIFSSRDSSFAPAVMAATDSHGVDVVLNSLAGPLLKETWNCMASFGRFIEIGKRDIEASKLLDMSKFRRNVTFAAVDLVDLFLYKGPRMHHLLKNVMELIESAKVSPVAPINSFPASEIQKAFRYMQSGKHMGKIVITTNPSDKVQVVPRLTPIVFTSAHSYLIVGGTGGLGLSIARWMAQKGATNLVLISRNAETSPNTKALSAELAAVGCRLLVRNCDAANKKSLDSAIKDCYQSMPQIKGVIQAAMLLQDSVLQHMTYEKWNAGLRPKVAATWNLHNALPNLDFFVMLSSMNGILGNPSQANYAAGNTFQDAFAAWRTSHGLHGVSIDLDGIADVGYIAQKDAVAARLLKGGIGTTPEKEFLRVIELAIQGPSDGVTQLLNGLRTDTEDNAGFIWVRDRRFSPVVPIHQVGAARKSASGKAGGNKTESSLTQSLQDECEASGAVSLILGALVEKIAGMFGIDRDDITTDSPVSRYGVDSLIAVELRNWIVTSAGADTTSIFDVLQSPSLIALAEKVARKSRYVSALFVQ